ncbi:predicted protein [Naegleria gruberi]|uniref:Predicted protein n=1 Tax=Naegleria gruberi TaxID=5762 RepID=D2UXZ2_NAEGR|nr:uncharacterized protein NAEGRDRAFT_61290 [Naegleria gruberi]EFC50708.1 predicted protein [Naegleria gruberi]|eukprot:XP_002683452.1 predicted protein [Naegleria gruberi strain NEG-M]
MVNSYYYENMLKSAHFHDNVGVQCDSGSFSFVDNNLEKNLVWQTIGGDLVLHELDFKATSCTKTLVIKSPENSIFLPGTSIKQTSRGIVIWLLSSNRTLFCLSINKKEKSFIEGITENNLQVDSFNIGTSDQEIEGTYNRLQQKSIFNGLFGSGSQDSNNMEFFKTYSEHFPTCLCAIDSQAVIVGLANGNLLRIIRDGSNFIHNTFLFETSSSWNWFSNKSSEKNLKEVFKNLTVSVQHLSLYENQLNIIASLHRDGSLLIWKEDSDTSVSLGREILPANNLKLLKINLHNDGINDINFCSLPLKITKESDDSTFQIIASGTQNDRTQFTVFGFQTFSEDNSFDITYNGVENVKCFSSEFLPKDIFSVERERKNLFSNLISYSLYNGTVWGIWSIRDYTSNLEENANISYTIAYGSLLSDSCQPSAWCFARTLHSQLSSGVSKFYGNVYSNSKNIGSYVEQFLFTSTTRLQLNSNLLFRSIVPFYPKDSLHSLTLELGITEDKPLIPFTYINDAYWSDKIKYAIEYTISQKRAEITTKDLLERNVLESKIEIQTWLEFLQTLARISSLNQPTGFVFMNSTPAVMYNQSICLLRQLDILESIQQTANQSLRGSRNYLLLANNLEIKESISKRSTFSRDLVEFFRILNFIDKSASELLSTFTVLPYYFSQESTNDNPAIIARKMATELVSGLSNHNSDTPDTLIKDFKQSHHKKLFVNGLIDRMSAIRNTPVSSILNYIIRTLMVSEIESKKDLISMDNSILIQLINASSIQILESRYQLLCQLCIFIEIAGLLTLNGENNNIEANTCYSLLRSYHLAWWLCNRIVESSTNSLNLAVSLSNSKLNMADFLLTHPSPTIDTKYFIEMLLTEHEVKKKLQTNLEQPPLSYLVTNISLMIIQRVILVDYESNKAQRNTVEIAQYLLNWQAYGALKRYCLLLQSYDSSFPLTYHYLALANLQEGDLSRAKQNFLRCAIIGVSNRERDQETLALFKLMNIYWKVEPTLNNQTIEDRVKISLLFYYYNYIRQLCEKHPELALEFINLSLTEADSDLIPTEEISILYSVLFSLCIHFERFDMAYVSLNSQNDIQRKKSDLRKFVGTLCDLAAYSTEQCKYFGNMLCELPFSGSRNDVNDLLHERAKYADLSIRLANIGTSHVKVLCTNGSRSGNYTLLEEHTQKLNTVFTYYHLLYSYNIHRGDYNKAAMYIYELGRRIESQIRIVPFSATPNDCHAEILEAYLQKQTECFLIALNALKTVSENNQWFLYPRSDEESMDRAISPLKRIRDDQMQVEQDLTFTKPHIITLSHLEKRYQLSSSKLFILQAQKKTPSFNILSLVLLSNPIDIISQFLSGNYETVEKAFMVASACKLTTPEMCILFSKLTKKCCESGDINTSGTSKKMWNLLRMKLNKYNNASTGYLFASSAIRTIYQELQSGYIQREECYLPNWLVKQCDPNSLLRIYLEFGKISEAQKLLVQKSMESDSSPLLTLPISQTLVEYVVKQ